MRAGDDQTDRAIVEQFLRTRDEESFRLLYRRHTPALFGLAQRLLAQKGEAEDVVQEMWIRGVERLAGFRGDSSLRTWLGSIAVNCCRERLRTRWRWVQPDERGIPDRPDAEPPVDLTLAVDRALEQLPAGCRTIFVLHDIEGRTHDEIAGLLDIAAGTSKSQLFHARRQLRTLLR